MHREFFENLRSGTVLFGRFVLERTLKASTYGGVYLCNDSATGAATVLKVLSTAAATDPMTARRFRNELILSQQVQHPHVISGKHFFRDEDFIAFTMDYIYGNTLQDWLKTHRPTPIAKALRILSQIASALAAIHEQQIVHRDITPSNIIVGIGERAHIIDFGLSNEGPLIPGLDGHEIRGTPDYLPPEYIALGEYDERADIYALGLVAYELITGSVHTRDMPLLDALTARVTTMPPHISTLRPDCPPELAAIIMRMLALRPEERPSSVNELRATIAALTRAERRVSTSANLSDFAKQLRAGFGASAA